MNYKYDVSVVIVCMNNLEQLRDCLNSIKEHTTKVTYEVTVVAYFFKEENLVKLRSEFPDIVIIISNEIRGFSANNNLALQQIKGKYCFVLNDDTYFDTPVIDNLVNILENHNEIALISPQIMRPDGTIQYSGIPPISWIDWILILFKLKKERNDKSGKYIKKTGLFKTYNILGAAFLIRTTIFKDLGYFDERYFFGPEDKALGQLLNKKGYSCFVDANVKITHLGGLTGGKQSTTVRATRPANRKGCVIFYSDGNIIKCFILKMAVFINSTLMTLYFAIKYCMEKDLSHKNSMVANVNVCKSIFLPKGTTEIFKMFYKSNRIN